MNALHAEHSLRESHAVSPAARRGLLINIDNGGTLTDFCVIDGDKVHRTKSVTTPYDLSKCFFDGLRKASRTLYGKEDVQRLLLNTDHIRYSTTQGTNALVERKGHRLGLVLSGMDLSQLQSDLAQKDVFADLVGARVATLDLSVDDAALELAATQAINQLSSEGANRIVIGVGGAERDAGEQRIKNMLLRKFPQHLLGAIPLLYSHDVAQDDDDARRIWTALFNAFLHPAMERFLYNSEHRLREFKTRNPLLIYRNDGDSARISRTAAVKTYSSGPRGGAEGAKALAAHYGFQRLLGMDIGGTTTDISLVENGVVRTDRRGRIEGVAISLPLCNVVSAGVGGSSIIKVADGMIKVGRESVGGAPGPACFGLGGKEATITDVFLTTGLLDPASYFGGELKIDIDRARAAIEENVAKPLKLTVEQAAEAMERAWVQKIADSLKAFTGITPDTTLAAFGGAGPFAVCKIAEAIGVKQAVIPGLAAVFSAFGVGFSDIAHHHEVRLASAENGALKAAREKLIGQARRGMFAEGFDFDDCRLEWELQVDENVLPLTGDSLPENLPEGARVTLVLKTAKPIARAQLAGTFGKQRAAAQARGVRRIRSADGQTADLPLYRVEDQREAVQAQGPCVLEEAFFTCRVDEGWRFEINETGDILLSRA